MNRAEIKWRHLQPKYFPVIYKNAAQIQGDGIMLMLVFCGYFSWSWIFWCVMAWGYGWVWERSTIYHGKSIIGAGYGIFLRIGKSFKGGWCALSASSQEVISLDVDDTWCVLRMVTKILSWKWCCDELIVIIKYNACSLVFYHRLLIFLRYSSL